MDEHTGQQHIVLKAVGLFDFGDGRAGARGQIKERIAPLDCIVFPVLGTLAAGQNGNGCDAGHAHRCSCGCGGTRRV